MVNLPVVPASPAPAAAAFDAVMLLDLLQGSLAPLGIKDQHQRWIWLNDAFCCWVGRDRATLLGTTAMDLVPPAEAQVWTAAEAQVWQSGQPQQTAMTLTDAQGRRHPIVMQHRLVRDEAGAVFLVGNWQPGAPPVAATPTQRDGDGLWVGVTTAINHLLADHDFDLAIPRALAALGDAIGVDQVGLFEWESLSGEPGAIAPAAWNWTRPDLPPSLHPVDWPTLWQHPALQSWRTQLAQGQALAGRTTEFAPVLQMPLTDYGIQSLLLLPLEIAGQGVGWLGLVDYQHARSWSDRAQAILQAAAGSFGGAIARQRMQSRIENAKQLLQRVVDSLPQYIAWQDSQGRYLGCNLQFAQLNGRAPREVVGQTDQTLPWTQEIVWSAPDCPGLTAGLPVSCELQRPGTTSSAPRWLNLRKLPLVSATGREIGWLLTIEDVTAHKQAAQILTQHQTELAAQVQERTALLQGAIERLEQEIGDRKRAEERQQNLLKELADFKYALDHGTAVAITDGQGRLTYVNQSFCQLSGYPETELLGQNPRLLNSGYHPKAFFQNLWQTLYQGAVWQGEMCNCNRAGDRYWVDTTIVPLLDDTGRPQQFLSIQMDISDRKQQQEILRQSEQRLSLLIQQTSLAVIEWQLDCRVSAWNPAAEVIFGYDAAAALGQHFSFIVPPAYRSPVDDIFAALLQQTGGSRSINENVTRDGRTITCEWYNTPLIDPNGCTIGMASLAMDITERIEAEKEQAKFAAILDATSDYVAIADATGYFTYLNPAGREMLRLPADTDIRNLHFSDTLPEALQEGLACELDRPTNSTIWKGEAVLRSGQGDTIPVSQVVITHCADDMQRSYLSTICRDISDRKRTEQRLKEQVQLSTFRAEIDHRLTRGAALQPMLQSCCAAIVEYLDAAFARIWLVDAPGTTLVLQASAGLYTRIDGSRARIAIGAASQIGWIAQTQQPHCTNDVLNDPLVVDQTWAAQTGMVAFAGHPLIVDAELLGVVGLFAQQPLSAQVLTTLKLVADEIALGIQRKRTQEQLQQSEARLREQTQALEATLHELQSTQLQLVQSEKMSGLGQLVAGVAHEINNPVNFIYGNLAHARDYTQDLLGLVALYREHYPHPHPTVQAEADAIDLDFLLDDLPKLLQSMKVGAERIQGIVASLRNFSRMDEAEMKAVDIHEGIDSTLMILHNRLKGHGDRPAILIQRDYGALPPIECYAGQLNQVLMNLLSNAIDALAELPRGDRAPQITIRTGLNAAQQLQMEITDNGPGIPDSVRSRIFDPFFTTKPVGKGTGMGLSISYQVITERHRGTLTCTSEPGVGTTFLITIPITQSDA